MMPNAQPSFREAIAFWFKLGFISFGGPAGQIATVHQELVEKKHWISEKRFLHALNYCMILPGPEALQLVIYLGWLMHRTIGGLIAGFLFILPAILLLIFLSILYVLFGQTSLFSGIFLGIKPAVTAIVIAAGYRISKKILKKPLHFAIAIAAFITIQLHLPYPLIILGAGLIGFIVNRYHPKLMGSITSNHASSNIQSIKPSLIDDDSPADSHMIFSWKKCLQVLGISLIAWSLPMVTLLFYFGKDNVFTQLAWFFTKAALLTFGGAYAVLPYVFQAMVENFHWLSPAQMIDGLALGETTPGPLIIVVTFVGFVAAHAHASLLSSPITAGILGALIVSWFTFLPSFCFIFLGAPLIESTRQELRLSPILNAITCAVVGVIATLAIFFALHTLFPENQSAINQPMHALISLGIIGIACLALIKYQIGIVKVLGVCAGLGLALYQLGLH